LRLLTNILKGSSISSLTMSVVIKHILLLNLPLSELAIFFEGRLDGALDL
jgi:hypothetical protein